MKKIVIISIFLFGLTMSNFVHAESLSLVDGDLIKTSQNLDVYIIKIIGVKKFKRLILNPDIFNSYGHLKWSNIKIVSQEVEDQFISSDFVIEVNSDSLVVNPKIFKVVSSTGSDKG
jgi:hypothetical protein